MGSWNPSKILDLQIPAFTDRKFSQAGKMDFTYFILLNTNKIRVVKKRFFIVITNV